jgi:uncharacterized membrane protein
MARPAEIGIIVMFLAALAIGMALYPSLPASMPSHWNSQGAVDGYLPKAIGLFLIPGMILLIGLLFIAIPRMDPLRRNIGKFRSYYDGMIIIFGVYMLWIYGFTLLWAMGITVEVSLAFSPAFALLFFYMGILMEKSKRNWFVGIRTPWTLSSDRVWEKTHRVGGRLFEASAIIALLGIIFPGLAILLIVTPVIVSSVYAVAYSYVEYSKEERGKAKKR